MKMTETTVTLRELKPSEGHVLISGNPEGSDDEYRKIIVARQGVVLGANDTGEGWREVTEAEATAIEARQRELSLAAMPEKLRSRILGQSTEGGNK